MTNRDREATSSGNTGVIRTFGKTAADFDRMAPKQIAIVVPEAERTILHGDRFERHFAFELIGI
jgi:hypothetical protein